MADFNKHVPYLEAQDFDSNGNLKINGTVVVLVWASWCPHCKNIKPAYAEAAKNLKGRVLFACAQQDGDRESEKQGVEVLSKRHGVRGFPTILLFKNGKMVKTYSGDRSRKSLEDFAK